MVACNNKEMEARNNLTEICNNIACNNITETLHNVAEACNTIVRILVCVHLYIFVLILGTAVLDGIVYAVGGFNGSLRVRTVECFDPIKHIWSQVTNMEARRSTLGTGVLNGLIFAVGGFDGTLGNDYQ